MKISRAWTCLAWTCFAWTCFAWALLPAACVNTVEDEFGAVMGGAGALDEDAQLAMTAACATGPTVKGIDVSRYQGTIDWAAVRADGVEFAFIRVSDGTAFEDSQFERNWREARAHGVRRGAYQFFRSNRSADAQADLLMAKTGPLAPGDLPPVIDVETMDGMSRAAVHERVQRWLDRVESGLGVRPIVYTGPYFWRDQVGVLDVDEHPLWIAHYGTSCPYVPPPWSRWSFHQHTDDGRVAGIDGPVDMNTFNGTLADLARLGVGGSAATPPASGAGGCANLPAAGGTIDDGGPCFVAGGDARWLERVTSHGFDGDLILTGATDSARTENFGDWTIAVGTAGIYEVEAFIDAQRATSRQARYRITHADGTTDAVINQDAAAGFVSLGAYRFAPDAAQRVRLNDNTGERSSLGRDLVFDALRLTRLDDTTPDSPGGTCPRLRVAGTDGTVNVRPEPNTSRAPVGTLVEGTVARRTSTVAGQTVQGNTTWHRVQHGAFSGYVTDVYVQCAP